MVFIFRGLPVLFLISLTAIAEPAKVPMQGKESVQLVEAPEVDPAIKAVLIGPYSNPVAVGLWQVIASRLPRSSDRKWFEAVSELPRESPFQYPSLAKPAAFLCMRGRCSVPLFTATELNARIDDMVHGSR